MSLEPTSVLANPANLVVVDCPELGTEKSAEIEARQVGELLTRGLHSGQLRLSCSQNGLRGTYKSDSRVVERRAARAGDGPLAENLLELATRVLEEVTQAEASASHASAVSAEPTSKGATEKGTVTHGESTGEQPLDDALPSEIEESATSEWPLSATKATGRKADPEEAAPSAAAPKERARHEATASEETVHLHNEGAPDGGLWGTPRGALTAQLRFSLWNTQRAGSLGPLLGGVVAWQPFALHFNLVPQWSTGSTSGFSTLELAGELSVRTTILGRLELGIGPVFSYLRARGPSQATVVRDSSTRFGLLADAHLLVPTKSAVFDLSVGARWISRRRDVLLGQELVLRIPPVQAVFGVGLRFDL